jgi:uncharacterized protein (TIRG00374 family)
MRESSISNVSGMHYLPWIRLSGVLLLIGLLIKSDIHHLWVLLGGIAPGSFFLPAFLILPLILVKTLRWQILLRAQTIRMDFITSLLAYFASLFVGFVTPGRFGEFSKSLYVTHHCDVAPGRAFSTVLADRLFDLAVLVLLGCAALISILPIETRRNLLLFVLVGAAVFSIIFRSLSQYIKPHRSFEHWILSAKEKYLKKDWLLDLISGFRSIDRKSMYYAILLTVLAYLIFYFQCYQLALALKIIPNILITSFAVTLGSLITLIPISISGLGSREAVITVYLATWGISRETALGFSLLVFANFYLVGGFIGFIAWLIKPAPIEAIRRTS